MIQLTSTQNQVAGLFVDLLAEALGKDRAVQSETAIASMARLSGSLLLRSFGFDMKTMAPGSAVLSEEANAKGPQLVSIAGAVAQRFGLLIDTARAGTQGTGHAPNLSFLESIHLLQGPAIRICQAHSLTVEQGAQAAAAATGYVMKECARSIGAEVAFNVAVYGFVEGTKTVPAPLAQGDAEVPGT